MEVSPDNYHVPSIILFSNYVFYGEIIMSEEQKSIILALLTGIAVGIALGTVVAAYHYIHKQPVSIQLDTPKQCTLKIGNIVIQGDAYHG